MRVTFHPQAWMNGYAVSVDAEGPTTWEVGNLPPGIEDDSFDSDRLIWSENAPQWVRDWGGPFWIEIHR